MTHQEKLNLQTSGHRDMHDITAEVTAIVERSGVRTGTTQREWRTKPDVEIHCAEINRCNQRGGRMLSIVDLIEAGTMTPELASYSLAAIGRGASFMVGALPSGAGKTAVMGALLNFLPRKVQMVAADGEATIKAGLRDQASRRCYVCHEIGDGSYYAYLWGTALCRYFALPAAGHIIATNLHADTYSDARRQICERNGVSPPDFRRMNLIYFLAVKRQPDGVKRRIASIWESDGHEDHRQVFCNDCAGSLPEGSKLVSRPAFGTAAATIDGLMTSGVRRIADVRAVLTEEGLWTGPDGADEAGKRVE